LVVVFCGSNDTDPIPEAVLLQELFCKIFQVTFREGDVRRDGDLGVALTDNLYVFPKLACLSLDLYAVMEELFEVSTVEDAIGGGFGVVDNEFVLRCGGFPGGGLGLEKRPA